MGLYYKEHMIQYINNNIRKESLESCSKQNCNKLNDYLHFSQITVLRMGMH